MSEEIKKALSDLYNQFVSRGDYDISALKKILLCKIENPEVIKNLGWEQCFFSGVYAEKNNLEKLFKIASSDKDYVFCSTHLVKDLEKKGVIFLDDHVNKLVITKFDPPKQLWIREDDNELKNIANSVISNINEGKLFSTTVKRHTVLFSMFDTYFKEHSAGSSKSFIVPNGEAFGLEIELKFDNVLNKLRFSMWLNKYYPNYICERDGSLEDAGDAGDCGLELVTPPLSYDTLMGDMKEITTTAIKMGGSGYGAGEFYGIHANTNFYGPDRGNDMRRFICVINNVGLRNFWYSVARRSGASFEKYCPFKSVQFNSAIESESGNGDPKAHYRATFCRPKTYCVETRIFRSNLKFAAIKSSVDILRLTQMFCMKEKQNYMDIKCYHDFIMRHADSELIEYLDYVGALDFLQASSKINKKEDKFVA